MKRRRFTRAVREAVYNKCNGHCAYCGIQIWPKARDEACRMGAASLRELDAQEQPKTPCDLCRYNPPSSRDGKPCTMCPASPVETSMQNGCDFARQLGFSGCTKCPIDCDVRQAQKEKQ